MYKHNAIEVSIYQEGELLGKKYFRDDEECRVWIREQHQKFENAKKKKNLLKRDYFKNPTFIPNLIQ
jgi:hypothetical protein